MTVFTVIRVFAQKSLPHDLKCVTEAKGSATISFPARTIRDEAPPGVYMMFYVNGEGVPSVAKMITLK